MSTAIHSGSFNRPAWRRWRARLAHFGVTGWLGLAVIAFWAAAALVGPSLLSQDWPISQQPARLHTTLQSMPAHCCSHLAG